MSLLIQRPQQDPRTPPRFRIFVLVIAALILLFIAFATSNSQHSFAQTASRVDYDIDDDGLIEVRNKDQLQAIHYDLNGDGTAETRGGWPSAPTAYATAYPTPMTAMGCPPRDHDNDPMTADQASCIGYELVNDINAGSWVPIGKTNGPNRGADFTGKLVGNGYRVTNADQRGTARWIGLFSAIGATGSVEGLGLVNPQFASGERFHGMIAADLGGSVIGSYVEGGQLHRGRSGGLVGIVRTGSDHAGLIAHSYSRGVTIGDNVGHWHTGLMAYEFSGQNGTNRARCLNSFSSGTLRSFSNSPQNHGLIANRVGAGVQMDNCYGDTDSTKIGGPDNRAWGDATATENADHTRTRAQLQNPTGYTGAFANWDDYAIEGAALDAMDPRTDFWYFGDSTTFPVLKGWGHDRTEAMARSQSGSQTVNLCTRTLAVANEIIRLLKDDDRAPGVTTTPAAVTALTDCTAASDTRNVSITNLTNLVVTSEANPFNLNPDRTDPASAKLTALDMNDFAYLTNATHFNLSGNSLTTLPPRLFQGVPLRWLNLSDNQLTTIPADLFAGLGTVTATTDNMLFLNGNSLTYTGIPGRVFDPLTHLNGIDLSDNSLTRVNTRWFENLANLGRRLATGATFQDKLGLHLSGNTITEHYYSTKLFTGIRDNITFYTGTTASDTLRTAIKNAITAAAGGTTPTTLDIDSTEHFNNYATPPAYLGVNENCPETLPQGPAGHTYLNGSPPGCYVSPKWSPPYVTGATTPAPTGFTLTGYPTLLVIDARFVFDADFIALQTRYRATPANPSDPWTEEWVTDQYLNILRGVITLGRTRGPVTPGTSYQMQLRALSRAAPPSTPQTATVTTPTSPATPHGLSATTSTTAAGAIELAWTAYHWGSAESKYQYRSKLSTAQTYGAWTDITGSDPDTHSHTVTGLATGSQYDTQIRFHWSDAVGASAASQTAMATASGVPSPRNFKGVPGTASGTVDLSWDAVPGATSYEFRCNPAGTGCTTTWTTAGSGTTHTVTGLTGGGLYSLELRAIYSTSPSSSATVTSRAQTQPGPRDFAATQGSDVGQIDLTWTAPLSGTVTHYEYRYKLASNALYPSSGTGAWAQVPDGGDSGTSQADETSYTIASLHSGRDYNLQLRVLTTDGYSLPSTATSEAKIVAAPFPFVALIGTNPGNIDLTWVTIPTSELPRNDSVVKYQFRTKLLLSTPSAETYTSWADIAGGANTRTYTVTGLSAGALYDVDIRAAIDDGGDQDSTADYHSSVATQTAVFSGLAVPADFLAAGGLNAGEVDLTWTAQTTFTSSAYPGANYQYRAKPTSANWPSGSGWTDIPGSDYRTSSHTVEGLEAGQPHDIELRFLLSRWVFSAASEAVRVVPPAVPVPQNVSTRPSETTVRAIHVAWDEQTDAIHSGAKHQVRYKRTSTSWPAMPPYGWTDVADGPDSGSHTHDEYEVTITGLLAGQGYDIELRFHWSDAVGVSNAVTGLQTTASGVPIPTGFDATTGSGAGEIDLSWNAVPGATGYQYRCSPAQSGCTTTWSTAGTGTSHTITNLSGGEYYNVQLRALVTGVGESGPTVAERARAQTTPGPATITFAQGPNPGEIKLDWTAPANNAPVTHYEYRYKIETASASAYSAWATVADSGDAGTSLADEVTITITGLQAGVSYHIQFRVYASQAIGHSLPQRGTQTARPVPPPTSFTAAAGTDPGEMDLSWVAPAGITVLRYELRHRQDANVAWSSWTSAGTATSYTYTGLQTGAQRTFQLRAVMQTVGASAPVAATGTPTPVAAPMSFSATRGANPGTIDLAWTVIPSSGLPRNDSVANYQFRTRLSTSGASVFTAWANITGGASTTSYTVTGLSAGDLYDIEVRAAIDDGGDQDSTADYHSSAASSTSVLSGLAVPADFLAASGVDAGEVNLSWTAQTTFGPSYSSAKYQYRAKLTSANWPSGGGWTDIPGSNYRTDSHTVEGLAAGQRHDIELRFLATSIIISAAATAQVSLSSSAVPVPQNVSARRSETTVYAIDVAWDAQVDTTGSEAKYQVRYKRTSTSWPATTPYGWTDVADGPDSGSHTHDEYEFTITGLMWDQRYDIELRFHWSDAVGASDAVTVQRVSASSVPTPTGFIATAGSGPGEIDLSWNAVIGATGYKYWCTQGTDCPTVPTSAGTGTSHTITFARARPYEPYNIVLHAALTDNILSPPTPAQRVYVQTTPGPASLGFSHGPNPGDIRIDWTAPANNAPVEHYEYRYKETESDSAYTAWQTVPDSGDSGTSQADETTFTIAGLQAGESYYIQFRVYASSSIGYSVPQHGTQAARPVPPPTSFAAAAGTNPGEIDLSWDAPAGITVLRYELRHRTGATDAWSDWMSAGTATSHTNTRLRANRRHTFQLRAVMQTVGASPHTTTSAVTTPVPRPDFVRVHTGTFPGEIDVAWSPVQGATSYEYSYRIDVPDGFLVPAEGTWRGGSITTSTSATITHLSEGAAYNIELSAAVAGVGVSTPIWATVTAKGATFADTLTTPIVHASYSVAAAEIPGRVAIRVPPAPEPDPFIYRYRTANPGQWSRWFTVRLEAHQEQYLIPELQAGIRYEVQVRAYTGPETGFTTALSQEAEATPLEVPEDFKVTESSGIIKLEWASPDLYTPDSYEYRSLPAGATTWSDWITVQHQGDRGTTQTLYVPDLQSGVEYQFELRVVTTAGNGPVATVRVTTRVSLPEINSIRPEVREVTLRAGDAIRLGVDVYNQQDGLDNSIPGKTSSQLVFRWSEVDAGGGSFADPGDGRRVVYTAPSSPGTYTITAEAQPDGICSTHHADASGISDANRAPCIATFTIRVTGAAGVSDTQPVPVNPAGVIPTELTDNAGTAYTVFTPVDGGRFTGGGSTVSAAAGAVPDSTIIGINASVSDVPVPAPVPGASMSVAGSFYDVNAIQQSGQAPLTAYSLDDALTVCLPFPDEFRADLSKVVVVQRQSDGNLSLLTTKVRSNAGTLTVCGAVSTLPATVGVAKLGTVPPAPATPAPEEDTPDTGATAPSYTITLLMLLTGLVILTGIILHIPVNPGQGAPYRASSAS